MVELREKGEIMSACFMQPTVSKEFMGTIKEVRAELVTRSVCVRLGRAEVCASHRCNFSRKAVV